MFGLLMTMIAHAAPGAEVSRVIDGLQVLYTFHEGSGATVFDVSGSPEPLDLTVADPSAARWLPGGGLALEAPTLLATDGPAGRLAASLQATDALTIEAWIRPENVEQDGPARIVSLSADTLWRNFTVGQGRWGTQRADRFDVRLRTTHTDENGQPSLSSAVGTARVEHTHLLYTYDGTSGIARLYVNAQEVASVEVGGGFEGWDASLRFGLGNELTGDRPWLGELHLVALYDRALSPDEVAANFAVGPGTRPERSRNGLRALYAFQEGSGTVVRDLSGAGALDLTIADSDSVGWLLGGGLAINAPTVLSSLRPAAEIIDAVAASHAVTIEAWLRPADITQDGPARIVSISQDLHNRNLTLGQVLDAFDVRLRTTSTSDNGRPSTTTPAGSATGELTHVIYTRNAAGRTRIFVDDRLVTTRASGGDLSGWEAGFPLLLGNELTGDRPWLGDLYMVAVYDRELSSADVTQNSLAGLGFVGELLGNGSFEDGLGDGWLAEENAEVVATDAGCGDAVLEIGTPRGTVRQSVLSAGVEPRQLYVVGGSARPTGPDVAGAIVLQFQKDDAASTPQVLSETQVVVPASAASVWTEFRHSAMAPDEANRIEVIVTASSFAQGSSLQVDCLSLRKLELVAYDDPSFHPQDLELVTTTSCTPEGNRESREACAVAVYGHLWDLWEHNVPARPLTLGDVLAIMYYREMHTIFGFEGSEPWAREAFFRNFWEISGPTRVDPEPGVTPPELVQFLGEKQAWYARAGGSDGPTFGWEFAEAGLDHASPVFRYDYRRFQDGNVSGRPFDWGNWHRNQGEGYEILQQACVPGAVPEPIPVAIRFCSEAEGYDYFFGIVSQSQDLSLPPTTSCNGNCAPPAGDCAPGWVDPVAWCGGTVEPVACESDGVPFTCPPGHVCASSSVCCCPGNDPLCSECV